MYVPLSDGLVVLGVEVLGEVVGQVFLARMPVDFEKSSFYLVANPKESHFHGARSLFLDGVVGDTCGGLVVAVDRCGWLFVTEFGKDEAEYYSFFDVHE